MTATHRRRFGFTLIELLVTVLVLIILLVLGVPAFADLLARTKLTSTANTLLAHLQYARSAAVKRGGGRVAVGPCNSAAQCIGNADWPAGQLWQGGYMVATVDTASPPKILQVLRRVDAAELTSVTIDKNGTSPRFFFHPDGSAGGQATVTLCDRRTPTFGRAVVVDTVGRVRVAQYAPGGVALDCP